MRIRLALLISMALTACLEGSPPTTSEQAHVTASLCPAQAACEEDAEVRQLRADLQDLTDRLAALEAVQIDTALLASDLVSVQDTLATHEGTLQSIQSDVISLELNLVNSETPITYMVYDTNDEFQFTATKLVIKPSDNYVFRELTAQGHSVSYSMSVGAPMPTVDDGQSLYGESLTYYSDQACGLPVTFVYINLDANPYGYNTYYVNGNLYLLSPGDVEIAHYGSKHVMGECQDFGNEVVYVLTTPVGSLQLVDPADYEIGPAPLYVVPMP